MQINYLSAGEITAINKAVVKLSRDPHGVMNEGNFSSSRACVEDMSGTNLAEAMKFKYAEEEDSVVLKAAFML